MVEIMALRELILHHDQKPRIMDIISQLMAEILDDQPLITRTPQPKEKAE